PTVTVGGTAGWECGPPRRPLRTTCTGSRSRECYVRGPLLASAPENDGRASTGNEDQDGAGAPDGRGHPLLQQRGAVRDHLEVRGRDHRRHSRDRGLRGLRALPEGTCTPPLGLKPKTFSSSLPFARDTSALHSTCM